MIHFFMYEDQLFLLQDAHLLFFMMAQILDLDFLSPIFNEIHQVLSWMQNSLQYLYPMICL